MKVVLVCNVHAVASMDRGADPITEESVEDYLTVEEAPLGLMAIASPVLANGHRVVIVDLAREAREGRFRFNAKTFVDDAANWLLGLDPDVIGFSSREDVYARHLLIARAMRAVSLRPIIVFGGPQATVTHHQTLDVFGLPDIIVRNEGEVTFGELVEALACGRPLGEVQGITWRTENGRVAVNADRPLVADLDSLPIPAYELYPYSVDQIYIEVGRGCPFGCTFCSTSAFFSRRYRLKSPRRLVTEISKLTSLYGKRDFAFTHDLFTANKAKVRDICGALLDAGVGINWKASARVDCVDGPLLETMVTAGCRELFFGIEHGSSRMQGIIKKNLDLSLVVPTVKKCIDLGIKPTCSFIHGFPQETENDIRDTLDLVMQLKDIGVDRILMHRLSPLIGTPIYQEYGDQVQLKINDGETNERPSSKEEADLIAGYPEIFASQLTVRSPNLAEESLTNLDTLVHNLSLFHWTVRTILYSGLYGNLWDLHRGWQTWMGKYHPLEATTRTERRLYLHFIFAFLKRIGDSPRMPAWYSDLCTWEQKMATCAVNPDSGGLHSVVQEGQLTSAEIAGLFPIANSSLQIGEYKYDVRRMIRFFEEKGIAEHDEVKEDCILVAMRVGEEVITAKLSEFLADVLGLCDGNMNVKEISIALREKYGQDESVESLQDMCCRAMENLHAEHFVSLGGVPVQNDCTKPLL